MRWGNVSVLPICFQVFNQLDFLSLSLSFCCFRRPFNLFLLFDICAVFFFFPYINGKKIFQFSSFNIALNIESERSFTLFYFHKIMSNCYQFSVLHKRRRFPNISFSIERSSFWQLPVPFQWSPCIVLFHITLPHPLLTYYPQKQVLVQTYFVECAMETTDFHIGRIFPQ